MFCHLLTFCGWIIPFGNLIAPLIVWLSQKEKDPFVDDHGKEALNFQITLLIGIIVSIPLCLIVVGFVLLFMISIASLTFTILAAIEANRGNTYTYPLTIRFIK